ncbi:uncharacterized protein LOC131146856 isoform X2 [Malania oleifera]|uniref:uncharacterized protein LOC131146856 isoform X2 n=1 Tax=Malania oleifera TaxID=397392 RepID=UPI0025ADC969|nr:uncharacterized protein LOC131146856 isoform X2 [Malania oleifera]XP_057952652.1 uncharacterized protein LOC131146856 isoform X2 [Malania oleifera]
MRRASTLLRAFSSISAEGIAASAAAPGPEAGVILTQRRLLQVALYGTSSNGSSYSRRRWFSPYIDLFASRAAYFGITGALLSVAAVGLLSQEAYAKEVLPPAVIPKDVVLYQYEACPFCNKVKAFLDYYDVPYKVVEVNPISKKEIKWSDYKKVPILMVDGEQLVDSSDIIDKLSQQFLLPKYIDSALEDNEEKKWRRWVDNHLVHVLSPNIYRNTSEALESFDYITTHGGSKPNLADLAVFGVLRPIRYLSSGKDMIEHTGIGDWYARMENAVGVSSRVKP